MLHCNEICLSRFEVEFRFEKFDKILEVIQFWVELNEIIATLMGWLHPKYLRLESSFLLNFDFYSSVNLSLYLTLLTDLLRIFSSSDYPFSD